MLGIIRKHQRSVIIKIVFAVIVLSFVGTIFLVWGRGEGDVSGSSSNAAKVNGKKITVDEYMKNYYRMRDMYAQIYGKSLPPELEKQLGIKKMALDNLIDSRLINAAAREMGLKITDDEVKSAIAAMPEFQKNGAFDHQQYQAVLKQNRLAPAEFEAAKKVELLNRKAREKVEAEAKVSDIEVLEKFGKEHDKVDLQFVAISPADVRGEVKLSEQDLNTYLQSHGEQFKTPEQISISYCVADPSALGGKVTVTDEEAQTYYQKYIDRYQSKGEILPFAEVKDRVRNDATKAKAASAAYEKAADALNKNQAKGDLAAAAASLGAKVQETPLFTMSAPPASLAGEAEVVKKAFSLKQGEIGGPLETAKGIYLVKLKEKKPAAVPPLAEIRAKVEKLAGDAKAQELAKKKAEDALAAMAKGTAGLKLQDTGPFGFSDKSVVPRIGASQAIMDAAFTLTTAAPVAKVPYLQDNRWYAIRLKNRIAADKAEFEKMKEQIRQSMLPKKQKDVVDAWLVELRKKAKIEKNESLLAD
jgi:peptidyl-prolyl cis-trans isomerase D